MDKNEEDLIVGGYRFATLADAETARLEKKKIDNLEQHLDYRNPQNLMLVYNVPLYGTFSNKTENNSAIRRSLEARGTKVEYRGRFITSVCINVLLVLAIAGLILVSLRSDIPTIVNYRTAVVNEYSEWEQELSERERAVREAERALDQQ